MDLKAFQMLEFINTRLVNIEKNLSRLEEKIDLSVAIQRNHLIRIKHGEIMDDHIILMGRPYNDLSPMQAFKIFNNSDADFILLDVSKKDFSKKIQRSIKIPLEELPSRFSEIQSKTTPILILCENGLRSIMACELLVKKGYFNVNNVSGGHQFWPGNREAEDLRL